MAHEIDTNAKFYVQDFHPSTTDTGDEEDSKITESEAENEGENKIQNKRVYWVDNLRATLVYIIVMAHSFQKAVNYSNDIKTSKVIYHDSFTVGMAFMMPLFIFISGITFTFKLEKPIDKVWDGFRRTKRLAILTIISFVIFNIPQYLVESYMEGKTISSVGMKLYFMKNGLGHLWFLAILLLVQLLTLPFIYIMEKLIQTEEFSVMEYSVLAVPIGQYLVLVFLTGRQFYDSLLLSSVFYMIITFSIVKFMDFGRIKQGLLCVMSVGATLLPAYLSSETGYVEFYSFLLLYFQSGYVLYRLKIFQLEAIPCVKTLIFTLVLALFIITLPRSDKVGGYATYPVYEDPQLRLNYVISTWMWFIFMISIATATLNAGDESWLYQQFVRGSVFVYCSHMFGVTIFLLILQKFHLKLAPYLLDWLTGVFATLFGLSSSYILQKIICM